MSKNTKFCLKCARPLIKKWNKRYNGSLEDFCNDICKKAHVGGRKPKGWKGQKAPKKKNGHKDLFNGR